MIIKKYFMIMINIFHDQKLMRLIIWEKKIGSV